MAGNHDPRGQNPKIKILEDQEGFGGRVRRVPVDSGAARKGATFVKLISLLGGGSRC